MKHYLFLIAAALGVGSCTQTDGSRLDPPSTVVNPDGTVTFNYRNDAARVVQVDVQFAGRNDMLKDSLTGLWSVTLGPAEPDMYPYCFVVDGVSVMDPQCDQWFPNEGFKNSLLDIPGPTAPLVHSAQNVPHGTVEYVNYYSQAIHAYNNAVVYLPPSYDQSSDAAYPVFYLISGTTDTWDVYYKVGRVNYILDNLIAQGAAHEMIVVMPYGNPAKLMDPAEGMGRMDLFGQDLVGDLMPYVEQHYRTLNDRDSRAIGGFSRGGNQGLMCGLTNLDKFSYLCSYSSFTSTVLPGGVYDDPATNDRIHLFWSGVGTDDFLYGTARDYTEFLDQKGIRCIKEYTTGKFGHTWMNAKYFLDKTLRLLFNPEASAAAMAEAQPTKAKTGEEPAFTPGVMARLFPKPILSPEFDGNAVTFRIKAPEAEVVTLEGEMLNQPVPMERDSDGVWSVMIDVEPDVYCYNFVVDGTRVCDNQNMYLATDRGFKRSVLNMPEAPFSVNRVSCDYSPVRYLVANQPDGTVSRSIQIASGAASADATLPSLCLVAGPDDTFESWYQIGHANLILDQLVAEGQCKPAVLYLTEQPMADVPVLRASDYVTWREARQALVKALKEL